MKHVKLISIFILCDENQKVRLSENFKNMWDSPTKKWLKCMLGPVLSGVSEKLKTWP